MKQPVFLRIYQNGKLENVKQFADAQVVIGRNSDVQVPLDSDGVSPLHAVIEERDSGYYVSDLGSQTGTFRNGNKVFDEKLESGDELKVGPYLVEFFIGVPKPKAAPKDETSVSQWSQAPAAKTPPPPSAPPVKAAPPPVPPRIPDAAPARSEDVVKPVQRPSSSGGASNHSSLTKRMQKSEGGVVQVVVAWGDRVLGTHHFSESKPVTIGYDPSNDIVMPLPGINAPKLTLLKLGPGVSVYLTPEMSGEHYKGDVATSLADMRSKGRIVQVGAAAQIDLGQGEMVRLGLHRDEMSIYVRFAPETAKPLVAPIFDLTASETTAVMLAGIMAVIFGGFMALYSPTPLEDEELLEEPLRKAIVTFNAPKRIVEVSDEPQTPKVVETKAKKAVTTNPDPGKAAELKPNKVQAKTTKPSSTVNQGGAVKTSKKGGANVASKNRDVGNEGLLSVFGSKGAQKQLSKAYSGSGELQGMAESATGEAGSNEDRAGDNLGGRLKNIGVGGKGTSTSGYSGIGTKGKGTGTYGYGSGGIGEKGNVDINVEGADAEFRGSIDKEAIRRVIRENERAFKFCYDTALRRNSDTYGRIEIQWDIIEGGRVKSAMVKSNSTGDKEFGNCVAGRIRGLVFPEPPMDEVARVTYPFTFTAK